MEPTIEPSAEPTMEPSVEPTAEPTLCPEPTVSPEADTTALPEHIEEDFAVTIENASRQEDGSWRVEVSESDAQLFLAWAYPEEALEYQVYVQQDEESMRLIGETDEARIELPAASYSSGKQTVYVGAHLTNGSIVWGRIRFEVAARQGGFPGGGPSGGGRPSGGSNAAGTPAAEERGFHITPGKALTSKHSSGTKNTTAYTCSEINDSAEAITALMLESTQTEITLDSGAAFFASKDDGKLQLTPESDGACWHLNALAMNTLAESGIDRVVFHIGGTAYSMPTRMEFSGSIYASLRAKGYVSKDVEISIDAFGVHVFVNGCSYSINDANELVPCEE